jgi:choline-sulfatase
MVDQLRGDWLAPIGPSPMPAIDRLAREGMVFERCYTNAPQCAPARIALAAGRNPWSLGIRTNGHAMPPCTPTWYGALRDAGYRTGLVGKADLNKPDKWNGIRGDRPDTYSWGFTHPCEVEGKMHAVEQPEPVGPYGAALAQAGLFDQLRADYSRRRAAHWRGPVGAADSVLPPELYADNWIGRRARTWLEQIGTDYSWFLQLSFVGPHDPYDPPSSIAAGVRDLAIPDPAQLAPGKAQWVYERARPEKVDVVAHARRQYTAALRAIDAQIGDVLGHLASTKQLDDTIVVFTSDHGDLLGDHDLWQKSAPYEGAARVPLIVRGPEVRPAQRSTALVELLDVGTTICDLVGVEFPAGVDARTFAPLLRGSRTDHRSDAVCVSRRWEAIVTDQHKFIRNLDQHFELYHLPSDPTELHNIAHREPTLCRALNDCLDERLGV